MRTDNARGSIAHKEWLIAELRFGPDGLCAAASSAAYDLLAVGTNALIGKRLADLNLGDAQERVLQMEHRLLKATSGRESFTFRRSIDAEDGAPVFIEAICEALHDEKTDQPHGFAMRARDATERVNLELQLSRAHRKAELATRAKTDFLANMSRGLRTPMSGVLGFVELMLDGELGPDQRHYAEMIAESGRSMMLLLGDILDLSKIDAGLIAIDMAAVDARTTIEDSAAIHRPNAERKGLCLVCEFAPVQPPKAPAAQANHNWVRTDGLRLKQIVLNLIDNAVKFTEQGQVTIRTHIGAETLVVEVTDTGIGISAPRLEQIFHPFMQGDGGTGQLYGGTGLGLSISRRLAELLGGSVSVESTPGAGSRFCLTLPVTRPAASELPIDEVVLPRPDMRSADPLREARILLAEDHPVARELLSEMLARCGQKVTTAHDGNEAISIVMDGAVRGRPFDLVLMDIQMPGCDGYAATRAIRAEGIGPQELPILALTQSGFPEDITAARDAGMQGHLTKPVELAKLARALQRWLPTHIIEASNDEADGTPSQRKAAR